MYKLKFFYIYISNGNSLIYLELEMEVGYWSCDTERVTQLTVLVPEFIMNTVVDHSS